MVDIRLLLTGYRNFNDRYRAEEAFRSAKYFSKLPGRKGFFKKKFREDSSLLNQYGQQYRVVNVRLVTRKVYHRMLIINHYYPLTTFTKYLL